MSILGGFYCSAGPAPGQVLGAVRSAGLLDNTVVMFTADHGDLAMELWSGTQKNVAPLKLRVGTPAPL